MHDRPFGPFARIALVGAMLVFLTACGDGVVPPTDAPPELAPQASGSFSSGSLRRGSVAGFFEGVGIGNTPHTVTMDVDGEQWFECVNNGGNIAPGQLPFTNLVSEAEIQDEDITRNGRFGKGIVEEGPYPSDDECKTNWSVHQDEDGTPIMFLRVSSVKVDLVELEEEGGDVSDGQIVDTFFWTCDDPAPVGSIEAYEPPELTGPTGVCDLDVDGTDRDQNDNENENRGGPKSGKGPNR